MKYFVLSLFLFFTLVSCQKTPTQTKTREDMLRIGRWKVASGKLTFTVPLPYPHDSSLVDSIPDCNQDDYLVFGPGFGGVISAGAKSCSPSQPQTQSFTWQPLNNDTSINLFGAGSVFGHAIYKKKFVNYSQGSDITNATFTSFSQNSFTVLYYTTYQDPMNASKMDSITYTLTFTNF